MKVKTEKDIQDDAEDDKEEAEGAGAVEPRDFFLGFDTRFDEAQGVGVLDVQRVRQAERVVDGAVTKLVFGSELLHEDRVGSFVDVDTIVPIDGIQCGEVANGLGHVVVRGGVRGDAVVKGVESGAATQEEYHD